MKGPGSAAGRGIAAGAIAATAIALLFTAIDAFRADAFRTPQFLAEVVLGYSDGFAAVALYTLVHYAAFAVIGILVALAVDRFGLSPGLLTGAVVGFLLFDLMFYGSVLVTGVNVVNELGWPAVLIGNIIAGILLAASLAMMTGTQGIGWGQALRRQETLREGLIAGVIGAVAVGLWFLAFDALHGRVFFTPAALGSALLFGARSLDAVEVTASTVVAYSVVHVATFVVIGIVAAAVFAAAERYTRTLLIAGVLLFVTFEVFSAGIIAAMAAWLIEVLPWWSIALGNLVAALAMGAYLLSRNRVLLRSARGVNLEEQLARTR